MILLDTGVMTTHLKPAECEARLRGAVLADGLFVEMRRKIAHAVIGRVGNGRFVLRRPTTLLMYQNSFRPVMRGRIVEATGGTRIEYGFGLRRDVEIFVVLWVVFAMALAVGMGSIFAFILPVAGVGIAARGYQRDSNDLDFLRGFVCETLMARSA